MYLNRFEIEENARAWRTAQLALAEQQRLAHLAAPPEPTRPPFCPCRAAKRLAAALRRLASRRGRQKVPAPAR